MSTDLQQLIISLLQAKGQALVVALVTGFTLLPVYLCVDSSEVLWLLLSRFREVFCRCCAVTKGMHFNKCLCSIVYSVNP